MRTAKRRRLTLAAAALAGGLLVGCGQGKPSVDTATTESTVTGTVTIHGKTPKQGRVIFDPSNHLRREPQRSAPIEEDGTYTITTLVGQNMIRVESPETMADRMLGDMDLYYDVKPGEDRYDIVLPPPM